jgi:hypothetical protein
MWKFLNGIGPAPKRQEEKWQSPTTITTPVEKPSFRARVTLSNQDMVKVESKVCTQIVAANARGYERRAHARTLQDEIDRKHAEMTWTTLGPPSLKKFEKYDSRGLRQICKLHGAFTFVSRSHCLFFSTVAPSSAQHSSMKCFNQLS